jgi:hypothetical protein
VPLTGYDAIKVAEGRFISLDPSIVTRVKEVTGAEH